MAPRWAWAANAAWEDCGAEGHQLGRGARAKRLTPSSETGQQGKVCVLFCNLHFMAICWWAVSLVLVYFNIHLCSTASFLINTFLLYLAKQEPSTWTHPSHRRRSLLAIRGVRAATALPCVSTRSARRSSSRPGTLAARGTLPSHR